MSAVHGIEMRHVVEREGGQASMGQSPFALGRGLTFERQLYKNDAASLLAELVRHGVLPAGSSGFADFRLKLNGGRARTLEAAKEMTSDALKSAATQPKRAPAVVAGATVTIPGGIMLPEATLVLDVLVIKAGPGVTELIVGEIKTYPDRAGYTDQRELATARAQAGIYVHGLELVLDSLGLKEKFDVQRKGFLVLSRPGSNQPSVRAGEDLRFQSERAKKGFDLLRTAAEAIQPLPDPVGDSGYQAVIQAETAFDETCLGFCDRVATCRQRAFDAGHPSALGRDMVRFLAAIPLPRAVELMTGAKSRNDAETDLVRRIEDAKKRGGLS